MMSNDKQVSKSQLFSYDEHLCNGNLLSDDVLLSNDFTAL